MFIHNIHDLQFFFDDSIILVLVSNCIYSLSFGDGVIH